MGSYPRGHRNRLRGYRYLRALHSHGDHTRSDAPDRIVRENFAVLSTLLPESKKSNIETAMSRYMEFENLKSQIVELSRKNTDLRAVGIALKEKRKAMLACQDALVALDQAIRAEPITSTIPSGRSQ